MRKVTRRPLSSLQEEVGPGDISASSRGWAAHRSPNTSHATEVFFPPECLSALRQAVLWAHGELTACSEGEAREYLLGKGVEVGNIDNVRKRRGELMSPDRGYVDVQLIERAPEADYGLGPTLDGKRRGAGRYMLTAAGRATYETINFGALFSILAEEGRTTTGRSPRPMPPPTDLAASDREIAQHVKKPRGRAQSKAAPPRPSRPALTEEQREAKQEEALRREEERILATTGR